MRKVFLLVLLICVKVHADGGSPAGGGMRGLVLSFLAKEESIDIKMEDICTFNSTCDNGLQAQQSDEPSEPNGCGPSGLSLSSFFIPLNVNVTNCCNQHDICYSTCGQSKKHCDDVFSECLEKACKSRHKRSASKKHSKKNKKTKKNNCEIERKVFVFATRVFGCVSFEDAQADACVCTENVDTTPDAITGGLKNY